MPLYHILIRNTTWKNNTPVEPLATRNPFWQRPWTIPSGLVGRPKTWRGSRNYTIDPKQHLFSWSRSWSKVMAFCRNMRRCQHGWEGEHLNPPDTWLSGPSFLAKSCLNNGLASHWSPSPSAQRSARRPGWSHAPDSTPRRGLFGLWVLTLQKWPSRTPLQDLFERGRLFQSSHGSGWIQ